MKPITALIIGAGPAGLTAASELLEQTEILPVVIESSDQLGGLSRTVVYKGNRLDIGGHRFFSHHPKIRDWWEQILPSQPSGTPPSPQQMLTRQRHSRILFQGQLYDYPLQFSVKTLKQLGGSNLVAIVFSYLWAWFKPIRPEQSLEEFLINRFGRKLYRIFFKAYTEKVWGVPCNEIAADWGHQRIKGVSIAQAIRQTLRPKQHNQQREASLIDSFHYPALGPGQLWQRVAKKVQNNGGQLQLQHKIIQLRHDSRNITAVLIEDSNASQHWLEPDYVLSSMPVCQLIEALDPPAPAKIRQLAEKLPYRDFITLGLLLDKKKLQQDLHINLNTTDNWLYIQEPDVKLGRVQLYHNWSPFLVAQPEEHLWIGLEYFCNRGDSLWSMSDSDRLQLAISEACRCRLINPEAVIDSVQIKVPKAYPAYFGSYANFDQIRSYTDSLENLFLIGRNGMHRYNNQDLAMLGAIEAVRLINDADFNKQPLWAVGSSDEYLG